MNIKNSIRLLLFDNKNNILLLKALDKSLKSIDGNLRGAFWFTVGGTIEPNETIEAAAIRELFEETGIKAQDIELGPVVWHETHELLIDNNPVRINNKFMVARSNITNISNTNLTEHEKSVLIDYKWWSLSEIKSSNELIYPIDIRGKLEDIINGVYPTTPIDVCHE